jgi:hypothetical protein
MAKSFGEILREAREANGLTTSQVASRTHILVKIIEALENEDFRKIPAPIYGRGFVRLYCEAVGLDSKDLIAEYMQIHSGAKTPLYLKKKNAPHPDSPFAAEESVFSTAPETQEVSQENEAAPSQQAEEPPEVPSSVSGLELFDRPQKITPFSKLNGNMPYQNEQSAFYTENESAYDSPFAPRRTPVNHDEKIGPSVAERFKSGISVFSNEIVKTVHNIPRRTWRIFTLIGALLVIVFFIGWMISKLYQVTSSPSASQTPSTQTNSLSGGKDTNAAKESAPSKNIPTKQRGKLTSSGVSVPTLYVD